MQHRSCSITGVEAGERHHCLSCMLSLCECQQSQFTQRICCPSVSLLNEEMLKMKLRHRDGFFKMEFWKFYLLNLTWQWKSPSYLANHLHLFLSFLSHHQDEDVHLVFLPAQVSYSSFSPPQGSTSPGCTSTFRNWLLLVLNAGQWLQTGQLFSPVPAVS